MYFISILDYVYTIYFIFIFDHFSFIFTLYFISIFVYFSFIFTITVKHFNFFNFLISYYSSFISITYIIVRKYLYIKYTLYFRLYISTMYTANIFAKINYQSINT